VRQEKAAKHVNTYNLITSAGNNASLTTAWVPHRNLFDAVVLETIALFRQVVDANHVKDKLARLRVASVSAARNKRCARYL